MKSKLVGGGIVAGAAALVAVVALSVSGGGNGTTTSSNNNVIQNQTTGTIDRTYSLGQCGNGFCWTCNSAVSLDSVNIVIDNPPSRIDGVKLGAGCTGTIGSLNITTTSSDAVKVAEGANDLAINGGNILCTAKLPTLHQDAIQVMGGSDITFNNMILNCGRANDTLIDSNFFVNLAGDSTVAPSNVVCDGCWLGSDTAHTVNLQDSVDSGVRNSTVCPGKFHNLTFTVGAGAVDPIGPSGVGNTFPAFC